MRAFFLFVLAFAAVIGRAATAVYIVTERVSVGLAAAATQAEANKIVQDYVASTWSDNTIHELALRSVRVYATTTKPTGSGKAMTLAAWTEAAAKLSAETVDPLRHLWPVPPAAVPIVNTTRTDVRLWAVYRIQRSVSIAYYAEAQAAALVAAQAYWIDGGFYAARPPTLDEWSAVQRGGYVQFAGMVDPAPYTSLLPARKWALFDAGAVSQPPDTYTGTCPALGRSLSPDPR